MGGAYPRNLGMLLDYFFVSHNIAQIMIFMDVAQIFYRTKYNIILRNHLISMIPPFI